MHEDIPKILVTFRIGGENGGPYISHKRIMESNLSEKYNIQPLMLPNPRQMRKPATFFKVVKQIKNAKPALVHLAGLQMEGFLVMLACRLARVKTVVAVHGSSTEALGFGKIAQFIFKLMETYTIRKATAVYGVSDYVSSWQVCRHAKKHCGTVYNIVDYANDTVRESKLREELGISIGDIVITSTGRITKDKGFDILWETIKRFKDFENVKFVIAGDGAYREQWLTEIEQEGLQDRVFLLGYRKDIDNILSGSDIFVICTKHETLCISLLEAAAKALPLVASDVGGIPEIIDDGVNGYLVPVGDVCGFQSALSKLINEGALRKTMGEKAKKKTETVFQQDKIIKRLDEIYKSVLEAK